MLVYLPFLCFILLCADHSADCSPDSCPIRSAEEVCYPDEGSLRFLLYSVRPGEGFNLCRDVYMRMVHVAVSVREKGSNATLVLPPWGPLPHWPKDPANMDLPWSTLFDVTSLSYVTPVMEMIDFMAAVSSPPDLELCLSHFPDTFSEDSKWQERYEIRDCHENMGLANEDRESVSGHKRSCCCCNSQQAAGNRNRKCVYLEGTSATLSEVIVKNFKDHESILISNADVVLHESYGSPFFWQIRRSMRFSKTLVQLGNIFRSQFLDSSDEKDGTEMSSDWRLMQRRAGQATGGNYLSLHWRRADFARYRKDVPSIQCTAEQASRIMLSSGLRRLFLATDAAEHEIDQLLGHLQDSGIEVHIFDSDRTNRLPQGQTAIIDQWICAHARYFIGSYGSTFSFRIQEEREILGFSPETTFNALCAKCESGDVGRVCEQETRCKIKYPASDTKRLIS